MTDKLLKKIAEEGTWHPQINEVMLAKYNCDYCVKGNWYCENKCPDRPPNYSPVKQGEILREAIDYVKNCSSFDSKSKSATL